MNIRTPVLFLIPARGGSKGIPRKNLVPLGGRPLIGYVIEAASCVARPENGDRVVVSTEDPEIADVARQAGAEVPFLRPAALSQDDTSSIDVLIHALNWLRDEDGHEPEIVILLQPTSPLVAPEDVLQALRLHRDEHAPVVSVTAHEHPLAWSFFIEEDRSLRPVFGKAPTRRQDVQPAFRLNGAIYVTAPDQLRRERTFLTSETLGYEMPRERSVDIDTEYDLRFAESLIQIRKENGGGFAEGG